MTIHEIIAQVEKDALKIHSEHPHITALNFRFENQKPEDVLPNYGIQSTDAYYDKPVEQIGKTNVIMDKPIKVWLHLWSTPVSEPEAVELLYPSIV